MGQAAVHLPMSSTEYLAWDEYQTVKHEFLHGELYAMTGVRDRHATTVGNLYMAMRQLLACWSTWWSTLTASAASFTARALTGCGCFTRLIAQTRCT